ncbi:hypothetical protein [Nostoc sp.]|uniref:hypothetical protein n=1 Tax=Nostoc sp. TaxID=1180 RepID=UPI002FF4727F
MKPLTINEGLSQLDKLLLNKHREALGKSLMIGIAGSVASGKSRFCKIFTETAPDLLEMDLVYLPFDYWINKDNLNSKTYAERLFLDDLSLALKSIKSETGWFCPRYDLSKNIRNDEGYKKYLVPEQVVEWFGRKFTLLSEECPFSHAPGSKELYDELETNRIYSFFIPKANSLYVIDGTMVYFYGNDYKLYDATIYVYGEWATRISRMIRRYNRKEVFGQTILTEKEYVRFLVNEARACADEEILTQKGKSTFVIKSYTETVSNLLDLYCLKQNINKDENIKEVYCLDEVQLNEQIDEAYKHFSTINDLETLKALRTELKHLILSKHLLKVDNIDEIFTKLDQVLSFK